MKFNASCRDGRSIVLHGFDVINSSLSFSESDSSAIGSKTISASVLHLKVAKSWSQ